MSITNPGALAPQVLKTPNKSSVSAAVKKSVKEQRQEAVTGLGQLAQVPLVAMKQYADAGAISLHWPRVSKEIAELADSQPAIANLIDPLMKIGPYTALVTTTLMFLGQIAVNHGRIAPGAMGTVPASSLSAQIETAMAQTEMDSLAAQLEAEKASAALRKEINDSRRALADAMQDHAEPVT